MHDQSLYLAIGLNRHRPTREQTLARRMEGELNRSRPPKRIRGLRRSR